MSVVFATQLTAVATLALAALALATAVLAGLAFLKQSREVGILLEQNQRDNDERRRAQASRVFIAAPRDEGRQASAHARNTSALPVYSVRIRYGTPSGGMTEPEYLATIMPGESAPAGRLFDEPDEALRLGVLTFRDAAGIEWIRTPDGELWEPSPMREDPRELAEFKLSTPDGPGVGDSLAIDTLLNAWKSSPRRASRRGLFKRRVLTAPHV